MEIYNLIHLVKNQFQTLGPYRAGSDEIKRPGCRRIERILSSARELTSGRLISLFGCGGDRDRGKRPLMGEISSRLADISVVTSDNPRSEDPTAIADAVAAGVTAAGGEPIVELDRRAAIGRALELADDHSLVLVAGKGHEATQTIGNQRIPFSDQVVICEEAGGVPCS